MNNNTTSASEICVMSTTFTNRIYLTNTQGLIVLICHSLAGLVVVTSNLLVIFGLLKTKQMKNPSNYLIFLLSVSDCVVGMIAIPLDVTLFSLYLKRTACILEYIAHFLLYSTTHFSAYLIAIIAVHRNLSINHNFKRRNKLSQFLLKKNGLRVITSAVCLVAIAEALVLLFFYKKMISRIALVLLDTIIFITVYAIYFWMYFKVWTSLQSKATKRLSKTIAIILLAVAIFYIPPIVIAAIRGSFVENRKISADINFGLYLSLTLVFSNSGFNAVVILTRSVTVRNFLTNWILCRDAPFNNVVHPIRQPKEPLGKVGS